MSYRLTELTDKVYVGMNSVGDLNIEVWTAPKKHPDAEMEVDAFVPADALPGLFEYLRRNA